VLNAVRVCRRSRGDGAPPANREAWARLLTRGPFRTGSTSQGFACRPGSRVPRRARTHVSKRSIAARNRRGTFQCTSDQKMSERYFKFGSESVTDRRKGGVGKINGGKRGLRKMMPAPAGGYFGATRSKSANTNTRHAHRLFSSAHQPSSASVTPARLPTPHINSKQRLDGKRALPSRAQIPPAWPFAIRATFTGLRQKSARDRHLN